MLITLSTLPCLCEETKNLSAKINDRNMLKFMHKFRYNIDKSKAYEMLSKTFTSFIHIYIYIYQMKYIFVIVDKQSQVNLFP